MFHTDPSSRVVSSRCLLISAFLVIILTPIAWADVLPLSAIKPGIEDPVADDLKGDPPGLLDDIDSSFVVDLAAYLSADRSWLTEEVLATLDETSLTLSQLFTDSPELFTKDGHAFFRIEIEKIGPLWEGFDVNSDPFAIFLTHETYTGLGLDRALALIDGQQTAIFEEDLGLLPLLGLSVQGHPEDILLPKSATAASFEMPITLGKARLSLPSVETQQALDLEAFPLKTGCVHEAPPLSCSNMHPVCASGSTPHFVVTKLKIRQDHEGLFKGKPEIELFPLNIDGTVFGSTNGTSTPFIFSGRTVVDSAGRSRYLPNVDNLNTWYSISQGVAVCPGNLGSQWAMTLVEDDTQTGILKVKSVDLNRVLMYRDPQWAPTAQVYSFNILKFVGQVAKLLYGLFTNDGDDVFQESIGVTGDLFCNSGVGQGFQTFTLSSAQWDLQGHFACINPSCAPMASSISGPSDLDPYQWATYSASVTGGSGPFTYQWLKNGAFVGSNPSVTLNHAYSFTLTLNITDSAGQTTTSSKYVNVISCGGSYC